MTFYVFWWEMLHTFSRTLLAPRRAVVSSWRVRDQVHYNVIMTSALSIVLG